MLGPKDSLVDQRSDAVIGEELEQHRMRCLAVDDDDAFDALIQRVDAGLDLRDHAARNGAVGDQLARLLDRELGEQLCGFIEHPGDVSE